MQLTRDTTFIDEWYDYSELAMWLVGVHGRDEISQRIYTVTAFGNRAQGTVDYSVSQLTGKKLIEVDVQIRAGKLNLHIKNPNDTGVYVTVKQIGR